MGIFGFLKKRWDALALEVALEMEERQDKASPSDSPPEGAWYKLGDIIHTPGFGISLGDLEIRDIKVGGYAVVYIVRAKETKRKYALKTFQDWYFDEHGMLERFVREARAGVLLGKHPHIVHVQSVLNIYGRLHLLLEYVEGPQLRSKIRKGIPLSVQATLKYAIQFCQGMRYARTKIPGFVHRDVKPDNCLLTRNGVLKITDFGHVKAWADEPEISTTPVSGSITRTRTQVFETPPGNWGQGTPCYMAPEQFDPPNRTDVRSDIYAYGVSLFEMLTGGMPFKGRKFAKCYHEHRKEIPPDPISLNAEIPQALAHLTLKCMAKSPDERPADFDALEKELRAILWNEFEEKHAPVPSEELTNEEMIHQGIALMTLDHYDEALACFDQMLASQRQSALVWVYKGDAFLGLGHDDEALACFDRALVLDSQLALAWAKKGVALDKSGQDEEALPCFERALTLDPLMTFAWNSNGQTLIKLGRLDEALTSFDRALASDPHCVEAHYNLGLTNHKLGRLEEAIEAYNQATRLNPHHADAQYNLGHAYSDKGYFKEAVESYKQTVRLRPDHADAQRNLENAYRQLYSLDKPSIGEIYAELVNTFLLDYKLYLDSDEPVYIIELGAGTGCFSFYLLKALIDKKACFGDVANFKIRYIMTDTTEENVKTWEHNEKLQPFREMGLMDFAVFRPENEDSIFLRDAQIRLCAETIKNPVITIANYFFDGLRQDLFRITDNEIHKAAPPSCHCHQEIQQPGDPATSEHMKIPQAYAEYNSSYYPDSKLNAVLDYYHDLHDNADLLFPIGAFDCIRNLLALSGNNVVILSSGKGHTTVESMNEERDHTYALHGSFYSNKTNYHAISRYFEGQGGHAFSTAGKNLYLTTTVHALLAEAACPLENSLHYFQEKIEKLNAINFYYDWEDLLTSKFQDDSKIEPERCLEILRWSNFDPGIFRLCGYVLSKTLKQIDHGQKQELIEALARIRGNLYGLERERQTLFRIGKIYYGLDLHDECLEAFHQSIKLYGPDDQALYFIAACNEIKANYEVALNCYKQALTFDSNCSLTQEAIKRMEARLAEQAQ